MASSLAFLPSVGPLELIILLVILIVIFGPKRIPQAARSLGRGLKNFRESVSGDEKAELPEGEDAPAAGSATEGEPVTSATTSPEGEPAKKAPTAPGDGTDS